MRNLLRYPITLQEKLEAIDWAIEKFSTTEQGIGDPTGAALQEIRKDLLRQGTGTPTEPVEFAG